VAVAPSITTVVGYEDSMDAAERIGERVDYLADNGGAALVATAWTSRVKAQRGAGGWNNKAAWTAFEISLGKRAVADRNRFIPNASSEFGVATNRRPVLLRGRMVYRSWSVRASVPPVVGQQAQVDDGVKNVAPRADVTPALQAEKALFEPERQIPIDTFVCRTSSAPTLTVGLSAQGNCQAPEIACVELNAARDYRHYCLSCFAAGLLAE
jgi:hypothetical protein